MWTPAVESSGIERSIEAASVRLFRLYGLPSLLVFLFVTFSLVADAFLAPADLAQLLQSAAISALMFLGLTWVFAIGEMDVSFVASAALANMITAGLVITGYGWPLATAAVIAASLALGFANGVLIATSRSRSPPRRRSPAGSRSSSGRLARMDFASRPPRRSRAARSIASRSSACPRS